jgi:peptidoglycan/xylan/chitin deacetylase (PgdA/CDA1 family)
MPTMPSAGPHVPLIVSIDVEPDGFFLDRSRPEPWRGYAAAVPFVRDFRRRAEQILGRPVRFSWMFRMDPQVEQTYGRAEWVVDHYQDLARDLLDSGDELGLHAHAYRWDAHQGAWIVDHGNQPWIDECLDRSFAAFARALGRPCTTFRFGDRWMSEATIRRLEALGVRCELTLEPGLKAQDTNHPGERFSGSLPDYSTVPTGPYRPVVGDFRRADASRLDGMWLIPVTTAPVRPRVLRRLYYRLRYPRRDFSIWTGLVSHEPLLFRRIVSHALARPSDRYLSLTVRSNALAQPTLAARVEANLTTLLELTESRRLVWMTPEQAIGALRPGAATT